MLLHISIGNHPAYYDEVNRNCPLGTPNYRADSHKPQIYKENQTIKTLGSANPLSLSQVFVY